MATMQNLRAPRMPKLSETAQVAVALPLGRVVERGLAWPARPRERTRSSETVQVAGA